MYIDKYLCFGADSSALLQRGFSHVCDLLQKGILSVLQSLKFYESNPRLLEPWYEDFIDVIQGHIQNAFLSMLSTFLQMAGLGNDSGDGKMREENTEQSLLSAESHQSAFSGMSLPEEVGGGSLSSLTGANVPQVRGLEII